ncbi:MAG: PAS domain-containing protein [Deltaproteobacteria bacterium]|nr:PAS domain-containing protein [Deltaproteobacteria bacterium]
MEDAIRALVDRMRELVAIYDTAGVVVYANQTTQQMFGADIVGKRLADLAPADSPFRQAFDRVVARGGSETIEGESAGRWLTSRVERVGDHVHVIGRDVTGDRQRLESVADSLPGLVGFVDMEARYQYVNAGYEAWLGRPRAFFLGKRIRDITTPELYARIAPHVERALAGDTVHFRQHVPYPSGERDVDAQYLPIRDPAGTQLGFAILILDVTSEIALAGNQARMTERLQRLLAVTGRLATAQSAEDVGHAVVDAGVEALEAAMAGMWLAVGDLLVLRRSNGFSDPYQRAFATIPIASNNPIATAVRERRAVWIASRGDYAQQYAETEATHRPSGAPPLAFGVVPIVGDGVAIGALTFVFHDERRLTAEERTYIEVLAAQSSNALARTRLYAQLVEALEVSQAMIQASPAAIVLLDARASVRAWNAAAERVFGWRAADVIGKIVPSVSEEQRGELIGKITEVIAGGVVSGYEATRRTADGRTLDVQIYAAPVRRSDGEMLCLAMLFDITERKRIERGRQLVADASAMLARSLDWQQTASQLVTLPVPSFADWCMVQLLEDNQLRSLAVTGVTDASRLPVFEHRPDRGAASRAIATGTTVVLRDLDDGALADIARDEDHLRRLRALAMRSYMAAPMRAGGRIIGAFLFGSRTRNFDDVDRATAEGLAAHAADAIENARLYREATTARAEAEAASRAKDQFLAMLGHELRNPLAPITTALELMTLRPPPHARERDVIARQVLHLTRLVDDLLDVSRITRGKIELARQRVTITSVVARAVELASPLLEQRSHVLSVDVPDDLAVEGDATRLAQILTNLLTNAARYTPAGGYIDVTARRDGDEVVVRVRDNGIGIDADVLPSVFDIFVQGAQSIARTEGGLGLGLAIVKSLVQMHGGTVTATSDGLGHGAMFEVRLPAAGPTSAEIPAVPPPAATESAALRVLVVDDNRDAAELMGELLTERGHDVRTAHDGLDALRVAAEFRPQVALLDIGLPVMDGYELAQRLREAVGPLRLIAVTGYGQASDRERARSAGFDLHLAKPVTIEQLYKALDA